MIKQYYLATSYVVSRNSGKPVPKYAPAAETKEPRAVMASRYADLQCCWVLNIEDAPALSHLQQLQAKAASPHMQAKDRQLYQERY